MELEKLKEQSYYSDPTGFLLFGDCLDWMQEIPDKSIDMIFCDLPYGTTSCKWDTIIPFEPLWHQYKRIVKDDGCIALFGSEPFSSYLRLSNIENYKYDWIWNKKWGGNFQLANKMPLKTHEIISIFNSNIYYPIKEKRLKEKDYRNSSYDAMQNGMHFSSKDFEQAKIIRKDKFPISIVEYGAQSKECNNVNRLHSMQKPVDLCEYIIKTYTKENELILDNAAGSCTIAISCKNIGRKWICIEKEEKYCAIGKTRIEEYNSKK
ncbi:MAG TPA: site-specific DNA-methyltransferase [Candidatus Glassbacteria bacterium]|nr:site-specific DNA-methyltransferase [Candidatus Glassbacteria bacterium]